MKIKEREMKNNLADFDYDKIKDMEYDPIRGCQDGKNGDEFHVTPYSNGSGYKYDYYGRSPYGNAPHNSTYVKSDLNENWSRTDNDRDNGTQDKSSGSGCYLTTACMNHMQDNFDDSCNELMTLRWFRDNFVNKEDIKHYYDVSPIIVDKLILFQTAIKFINGFMSKLFNLVLQQFKTKTMNLHTIDIKIVFQHQKNNL